MLENLRATYVFFLSFYPEFIYVANIKYIYKTDVDLRMYLELLKNYVCVVYYFNWDFREYTNENVRN